MSDSRFEANSDGVLKLKEGVRVEDAVGSSIPLRIAAKDSGGLIYTASFTLQVTEGSADNGNANNANANSGNINNGNANNGNANNGNANNSNTGTATPSDLNPDNQGQSRNSGGGSSGSSFRGRRSLDFGNISVNPYSYIQTNGRIHDHGSWKQEGTVWKLDVDGATATSAWAYLSGNWYLFNEKGEMMTGWANVDGSWYYMDGSGSMRDGWVQDGKGEWYYLNPVSDGTRGAMRIGWQLISSKWYYFHTVSDGSQGRMLKSQRSPDGYLLKEDGSWDQGAARQ